MKVVTAQDVYNVFNQSVRIYAEQHGRHSHPDPILWEDVGKEDKVRYEHAAKLLNEIVARAESEARP